MTRPLPPHSIRAEEATLGSLLLLPDGYGLISGALEAEDFYKPQHRTLYEAIGAASRNGGVDPATVADHLGRMKQLKAAGGMPELMRLMNDVVTPFQVENYAATVADYALRRRAIGALSTAAKHLYDLETDAQTAHARAEGELMAVRRGGERHAVTAQQLASQLYDQMQDWMEHPLADGEVRGLPTGIRALDRLLGGLQPAQYIIAARPSMGKTAMMLQMASGIAEAGGRVVFFTIEMSAEQCGMRIASCVSQVELQQIKRGKASEHEMHRLMGTLGRIGDWPLKIIDQSTLRPGDVLSAVRREQIAHGSVVAVFVDGLWLMTPTKETGSRVQDVGSISREMKRVQRELDVPIVMAHQLNRNVEYRSDKRPLLADLRETGDVEQDADVVLMLYREGVYEPKSERANVMEILCRKNRVDGPAGTYGEAVWRGKFMRLDEMAKEGE